MNLPKYFKQPARGFTLLEVIVSLIIMAMIVLLAAPNFAPVMDRIKLKSDAVQLAWVLKNARQEAISSGVRSYVIFYKEGNKYKHTKSNKQQETYYLSEGIRFAGNNFTMLVGQNQACSFTPSGAPGQAGTITLSNRSGRYLYVIVNLASGRIRVSESPPSSWE